VKVTVIAAGFDRTEASPSLASSSSARINDLFVAPAADPLESDEEDEFDVPSFLK
jgi:hypothetical protein